MTEKTKILLIDDEDALREMMVDELTAEGHDVVEAANGEEGLKKLLEIKPDLVLCDRAMPGMSGYELLEIIREKHPEYDGIPFVFLTALTDARDREAVDHLRPAAYIEKPVDFGMLEEKIKVLVRKK